MKTQNRNVMMMLPVAIVDSEERGDMTLVTLETLETLVTGGGGGKTFCLMCPARLLLLCDPGPDLTGVLVTNLEA